MKGIVLMAKRIAAAWILVIALSVWFVGCASNKERQGVVVRDAAEFYSALQNKETLILADDLTFDEETVIQINYGLTITGNGKKATIKNAHFKIISPNVAGETNAVTFENIILDGGCYEEPAGTDKTFEEAFGGEREENRCITADWGYIDLALRDVEIKGYASIEGSALYIGNKFRDGEQTLLIENCEFYGNTATNKGSILYTQPYAYWTKKYNGGQINLLFSKAANNTAPDRGTFGFYEADGLLGYIVLRGCMVIGDDEYETSPSAYNYIATATEALDSGAINDLNIADGESVYAVKGSCADIDVPANVYRSWHSAFAGATQSCAIGEYNEMPAKPQINVTLTIVLVVIGTALFASFVVLFVVFGKKRKTNGKAPEAQETGAETSETEEQQPVAPVMTEKERIDTLTEREYKIVALTLSGKTREQIAEELHFSLGTIKFDLMNIYRKLACSSRTDLILRYKDYF